MNNRDTIPVIIDHLDVSLLKYCNPHAVKTYAPLMGGIKEEPPKDEMMQFPLKKFLTMKPDKKAQKKTTTYNLDSKEEEV